MTVYNGRYEISNQVARGGTAQVYLARDLLLDRPVALKVLFPELSTDPSFVERFRREAQAAANLSHPNIVPVFDWGQSESTYFIVMEYVDGEALSAIIRSQAPLDQSQAASIAADIAKALSYAHRHGVVHRDVKPGNVLITSDGQVKVTDFGIARAMGSDEQVTQTGLVMGTATYFSPEQAQGLEVDGRSDIYSLGVVLYEMLTGRPPFAGDTPVSIAYQHVRETPTSPRTINPSISASLDAIVSQAMAKLPAERYQTADEFRADLDRYVRGQTVLARLPSEIASSQQTTIAQPVVTGSTTAVIGRFDDFEEPPVSLPPKRAPRTTPYWVAAGVVLVIVIVVAGILAGRSLGYFGGAKFSKVPYVTGETEQAASQKLTSDGLVPVIVAVPATSAAQSGRVVRQDPSYPSSLHRGDKVMISVAGAAPHALVPSVTGEQFSDATKQLSAAGFQVRVKRIPGTAGDKQGTVKTESPKATTSLATGSTVTISVVSGQKQVKVPNLLGQSLVQAVQTLATAGFSVNENPTTAYSSAVPKGDVISSTPTAGSQLTFGTTVTLVLSNGPGADVPTITYKEPVTQAVTDLTTAGLTPVQEVIVNSNPTVAGLVRKACLPDPTTGGVPTLSSCVPASGTQNLAPGSSIYLFVWETSAGNSGVTGSSSTTSTTTTLPGAVPPAA
jgi:serine/threonine-protein kinase